ncbi:HDOD domain-containing protein [Reinekea marina]|uniref:HDOD domain-containing protein n=1 Tax=Reinekea marina TaxID=1310421 RepID=A0ABV7WWQ4_9GAMM|nr:HDOD domain-containing protein [Reinekea marina]MBU2865090.1 HDOD domain-containing protein [Reinekea forsetii]MDN3650137.1 HDOD domain-containing protein [Reinekea marina]
MSNIVETVTQDIIDALNNDQLTLPSLPEIALKVRDIAELEDTTINDLTDIIIQDSALTARIIRVVNSPLLRAPQEVKNLPMAVSRLGMNYTSNLAIGLAMEQMFQATSEMIEKRMRALWQLTGTISTWASVLATHTKILPPDEAMLAGLVHRLGALPILAYAEERDDIIQDNITLGKIIDRLHGPLGEAILKKWEFSEDISQIPKLYRKTDRVSDEPDFVGLITLANLIHNREIHAGWGLKEWKDIKLFDQFHLPADKEHVIYNELEEKVKASRAALM